MEYIDFHSWPRKEHFRFFSGLSFPFYGVTLSLDVTNLRSYVKAHGLSFYYALIYATLTAMNGLPDFLYKIRGDRIVRHDRLHPSFVVLDEDTHLIKIVNVSLDGTMEAFCRRAEEQVLTQKEPFPDAQQENRDDLVYISCTPWFSFTSLSNEMDCDPNDSIPRITWGKYEERNGRLILPYAVQLNHRLLDGWHVAQLLQAVHDAGNGGIGAAGAFGQGADGHGPLLAQHGEDQGLGESELQPAKMDAEQPGHVLGDPKIGHQDIVRTLHRQNSFPREEGLFRVRTEHIAFCGVRQFSRRKFYEMFINREEAGPR